MNRLMLIGFMLCVFTLKSKAQNLVPNPSFETYTMCPNNTGQINNAVPWIASISSPDYFNACSSGSNVSVPKNFSDMNYQTSRTGNAYAGFEPFAIIGNNSRENLSVQLISNLINNSYYLAKFYVANAQLYPSVHNNIALNFSNILTTTVSASNTVNLPMHIYKFGNPIIADTLNWVEIMGIYKANGTEQYITIGNFKDDGNTTFDLTRFGSSPPFAAYYMIEDVSVEPICTPFWSYRDTTVAIGDSVLIGPAITGLNINWYDATGTFITNAPGIYVKPNSPTFYTATEDFCGSIITYTINVGVSPTGFVSSSEVENSLKISPNPVNTILQIVFKSNEMLKQVQHDGSVKITDVSGREVLQTEFKEELDISQFDKGIYFISIQRGNKTLGVKKIIKE